MLTVSEALAAIVSETPRLPPVKLPLAETLGLVLAEDAISDLDSPPFDKALMDGYAVRAADLPSGKGQLQVIDEIMAGQVSSKTVGNRQAIRIMTGAPLPTGADAVIPVEHTRLSSSAETATVEVESTATSAGRNILRRGESMRKGDRVLSCGTMLRPQELGALAELGKSVVSVFRRPRVAVLATGDELVAVEQAPGPGQIRNSNETMLVAQLQNAGVETVPLGIARDRAADLRDRVSKGLQSDVLLLSGGVSAGKLDLVPSVLAELGVRQVFHKVRVKPGQPVWFGVLEHSGKPPCCVFGLPGNPVSSMVCCELFARTALRRMMGMEPAKPVPVRARLLRDFHHSGPRPTYHPAKLDWTETGATVDTVPWVGSADLSATVEANAMAVFPEGDQRHPAGTILDVIRW